MNAGFSTAFDRTRPHDSGANCRASVARNTGNPMPARPCIRCGALTPSGSYCPRHRPSRFNRAKRGSGWQASRFRKKTLAATGGRCAVCGSTDGVEAHHLGASDAEGGVALCRRCHRKATNAERLDRMQ